MLLAPAASCLRPWPSCAVGAVRCGAVLRRTAAPTAALQQAVDRPPLPWQQQQQHRAQEHGQHQHTQQAVHAAPTLQHGAPSPPLPRAPGSRQRRPQRRLRSVLV